MNMHNTMSSPSLHTIYLAAGCFWGAQGYFKQLVGVVNTNVGYANGTTDTTNYETVKQTDHAETVCIDYDANTISLAEILRHYFRIIDPLSLDQQGADRGRQYRTGIFYADEADLPVITTSMKALEQRLGTPSAIVVEPLRNFVLAEDYHQDYLDNHPGGYCHINLALARQPLEATYQQPDREQAKQHLSQLSYEVTQHAHTEHPFTSPYAQSSQRGIYVDIVSKVPLFSSRDQFDAGCGWPSFTKPISPSEVSYHEDYSHAMHRKEVKSSQAESHLGHVFTDGPEEQGGLRYCINGASLEFIPEEQMIERGYGAYLADL